MRILIPLLLALALFSAGAALSAVYVDADAPGPTYDGTSWATAFLKIQQGVNAATPNGEVWVAEGAYVEQVVMAEGVAVYGGFLGAESSLNQRDYKTYVTTIRGDVNSPRSLVVMANGSRLDGFTVTEGRWTEGAGVYCNGLTTMATIANNVITGNTATSLRGGGICCVNSVVTVTGNTITFNTAGDGGGISWESCSPIIVNNVIADNTAVYGGGIFCYNGAGTVANNIISHNGTTEVWYAGGGGMCCYTASPLVANNTFWNNSCSFGGGAIYCLSSAAPTLANNIFANGLAGWGGGVGCEASSGVLITHNVFWENYRRNPYTPEGVYFYNCDPNPQNVENATADPLLVNPAAGDFHIQLLSPCINTGLIDPLAIPETDFEGDPRILGGRIDIGADELVTNKPPTAEAGADQSIHAGQTVNLDGSASFDDNTPSLELVYAWTLTAVPEGSSATLTGADTSTPSFVADRSGTYIVSLVVTDEEGLAGEADTVSVSSLNGAPTADAGSDVPAIVGDGIQLDGSESADPDSDPLAYYWEIVEAPEGSMAILAGADTATPILAPDLPGEYVVQLIVTDGFQDSEPDLVSVTAITAQDFAEYNAAVAQDIVSQLPRSAVTSRGNQRELARILTRAIRALQNGNTDRAIRRLNRALNRTDGYVLRGRIDRNGPGRDWVTDRDAQEELYWLLRDALDALAP